MNYDFPWSFYNGMDGRLESRFSRGETSSSSKGISHVKPSGKAQDSSDFFNPIIFVLFREADRFGVNHTAKVLVQRFREKLHIQRRESIIPFVYELELRGAWIYVCW